MITLELITKICDADGICRPVIPVWVLASREYAILEIAELLENIRAARN